MILKISGYLLLILKKDSDRVYAGSKGIGRFSCDRLGTELLLTSKKEQEISELSIDWGEFEKDSLKQFEDLDVSYRSGSFLNNDLIESSGTVLKITGLRDEWDANRVNKVVSALQRLINPFVNDDRIRINVKYFSSNSGIAEINTEVSNNIATVLDKKTIYIECDIRDRIITVKLVDKEKKFIR